jgi:uncharacterized FlaG/YvyC family protein
MLVITNLQQANALQALRLDRKRELLEELSEINNELNVIDKWIKMEYDKRQGKLVLEVMG